MFYLWKFIYGSTTYVHPGTLVQIIPIDQRAIQKKKYWKWQKENINSAKPPTRLFTFLLSGFFSFFFLRFLFLIH